MRRDRQADPGRAPPPRAIARGGACAGRGPFRPGRAHLTELPGARGPANTGPSLTGCTPDSPSMLAHAGREAWHPRTRAKPRRAFRHAASHQLRNRGFLDLISQAPPEPSARACRAEAEIRRGEQQREARVARDWISRVVGGGRGRGGTLDSHGRRGPLARRAARVDLAPPCVGRARLILARGPCDAGRWEAAAAQAVPWACQKPSLFLARGAPGSSSTSRARTTEEHTAGLFRGVRPAGPAGGTGKPESAGT